jgi:hypothetical protein
MISLAECTVKVSRLIYYARLATILIILFNIVTLNAFGNRSFSLLKQPQTTVSIPPVILQQGTAGMSTIYANGTSAKARVKALSWWNTGYAYRKQITIRNNNATSPISRGFTVGFSIDTQQMVSDGKLQPDGDDFRIVWWNSSSLSWLELDRLNLTNFTSATTIKFRTQASISGGSSDDNYYVYYGKSSATNPPANGSNVYFFEDLFNRADSSTLGLGWKEYDGIIGTGTSDAGILNNNLNLRSANQGYDTQAYHLFNGLTNRSVWEFGWNYKRNGSDSIYSMWMQLGKYSLMSNVSNTAGASIYMDWTGTGAARGAGASAHETLRAWNGGSVTEIGVLSGNHDIKLDLDLTNGNYTAYIDGKNNGTFNVYQKLSSYDCIRFVFEQATVSNFESYSHDYTRLYLAIDPSPSVNVNASEENNIKDYVDNNMSNVDSSSDKGTHSNFTAQQYGPDSIYDTLTEESVVGSVAYENSAESYSVAGQSSHSFNYVLQKGSGNNRLVVATVSWEDAEASAFISSLTFGGTAMTKIVDVTVGTGYSEYISLWYLLDSNLPAASGSYNIAVTVSESIIREIYVAVAEYSGVKQSAPDDYGTHANTVEGNTAITLTAAAGGSVVVAGVGESGTNVLTDTNNINNLQEQILTSSGSALGHHMNASSGNVTVGWNSLSTREGMAGAVWQPASIHRLDLEIQWTGVDFSEENEELCIRGGSMGAENLRTDVWNGSSWHTLFASLINGWNNASVSTYLTSANFTIRFKGATETADITQDGWNIDAALLHVWSPKEITYDHVLKVNNTIADSWQIRLKAYSSFNISRLQNCTIHFHNTTDGTSAQIVIENGSFTSNTGSWYDLDSWETTYIAMTVKADNTETSYIYVYLEILTPGTTTYIRYTVTLEIT